MKLTIIAVLLTCAACLAPPMVYPECNDGDPDTMDFCGGCNSIPIPCYDDYNDQGAHDSMGSPIPGSCCYLPRPLRNGGGDSPPGMCHTALGWYGALEPESFADPFFLGEYAGAYPGSRFLHNSLTVNPTTTDYRQDAAGAGGYTWAPTNVNNAAASSCGTLVNQGIGAVSKETHSVSYSAIPSDGCGFKHGIPLDTDKNMGMLVSVQYYPYTEYIVRVYWSATDVSEPFLPAALEYLGCIDHTSPTGTACTAHAPPYDVVGKNALYLVKPTMGDGIIQVNIVRDGPLGLATFPRGELYFIFDAIGTPNSPPSIDSVMFMYLNLFWANGMSDCRYLQQCVAASAGFPSSLSQATIYGTAVLPADFTNPCGYAGDPCDASVCNGVYGSCDLEGWSGALDTAPSCSTCNNGDRVVSQIGCQIQVFTPTNVIPPQWGALPAYRTLFQNDWDSYGKLEFCNTRFVEGGDNSFMNSGRTALGIMQWVWYVGASVDPLDIQYMNLLSVSRLFPLDPTQYPDGASLKLDYLTQCASFVVQATRVGYPPINIYCSQTLSQTPGSNDAAATCDTNSLNSYTIMETAATSVTLDVSTFIGGDYYITVKVDNDVSQIFTAIPACASVGNPYVQLVSMAITPTTPACSTGDLCETGGRCSNGTCVGTPMICDTPSCAVGTCSAGVCNYVYNNPSAVCNDNNVCTTDTCTAGGCTNVMISCPVPPVCNDVVCDPVQGCGLTPAADGTFCPAGSCEGGVCVIASACSIPADCSYLADQCTSATCSAGNCVTSPIAGPCTLADQCQLTPTCQPSMTGNRGVCTSAGVVTCNAAMDFPANELPCLENYACDTGTGLCTPTWFPAGTVCDEGDACIIQGVCDSGHVCQGTSFPCPPSDGCNTFTCNAGVCSNTPQPDGQTCTPQHIACGTTGECETILPGVSACEVDVAMYDCTFPSVTLAELACLSGIQCEVTGFTCTVSLFFYDEDEPCTLGTSLCHGPGQCVNNECQPSQNTCSGNNNQCMYSECNPGTGQCVTTPLTGQQCITSDLCDTDGMCVLDPGNPNEAMCQGTPMTCQLPTIVPTDPCISAYTCDPSTGLCGVTLVPDGTACDDSNACTTNDQCTTGVCLGTQIQCNVPGSPGASALLGMCDQGHGPSFVCDSGNCVSINGPPGPANCDDGVYCNGPEIINAEGACVSNITGFQTTGSFTQCDLTYCDEATDSFVTVVYNENVGMPCQNPHYGICRGTWACSAGNLVCSMQMMQQAEICGNGLDDNCNGYVDEGCTPVHHCNAYTPCPAIPCYHAQCVETNVPNCPIEPPDDEDGMRDDDDSSSSSSSSSEDEDWKWKKMKQQMCKKLKKKKGPFTGPNLGTMMCQYTQLPASTPCSLPDACFSNYVCDAYGACVGTPVDCSAYYYYYYTFYTDDLARSHFCQNGVCHNDIANHSPCNTMEMCVVNTQWNTGLGQCAGTPLDCSSCNQCATTICSGVDTCDVQNSPGGTPCTDNDACTEDDQCDGAGGCVGTPVDCTGFGAPLPMCGLAYCDDGCKVGIFPWGGECTTGIDLLDALEGDTTSRCINGECHVSQPLLTDDVSPGCGGPVKQCVDEEECKQWMSDFIDIVAEQGLALAACTHTVYNATTHMPHAPVFSVDDTATVVTMVVNKTLATATVREWVEFIHAELAVFRYCEDYAECDTFLKAARRLRAIYDIHKGLLAHFECPALHEYGIVTVNRQPKADRWWMFMTWDDSIDISIPSDYDLNDLVVAWHVTEGLDENGYAVLADLRYELVGRGSYLNHHLKWMVKGQPCSPTTLTYSQHNAFAPSFASFLAYKWHYHPATGELEAGPILPVGGCLEIFHNTDAILPVPNNLTLFANTIASQLPLLPHRNAHVVASVNYGNKDVDPDNETLDSRTLLERYYHMLYVVGKQDLAALLVQIDGGGQPTVLNPVDSTRMNLPMMQNLPCTYQWPVEQISVFDAYPGFNAYASWLELGGVEPAPWYTTPVNSSVVYQR